MGDVVRFPGRTPLHDVIRDIAALAGGLAWTHLCKQRSMDCVRLPYDMRCSCGKGPNDEKN